MPPIPWLAMVVRRVGSGIGGWKGMTAKGGSKIKD